jgi:hypothetical protein
MSPPSAPVGYRVVIRHNLVIGIERFVLHRDSNLADDPLAVSSQFAQNYLDHGCVDGSYEFMDSTAASHFAELSLDFIRRLAEKSSQSLTSGAVETEGWSNPHLKAAKTTDLNEKK